MLFQAAFDFRTFVYSLQEIGAIDVFLPFLLVFAIVFAVLEKTKVLGNKSNINVVVAFVIGVLLVAQQGIVQIINEFLPKVSLILVVALMLLLVLSMIAGKEFGGLGGIGLTLGMILAVIAIFVALNPTVPEFLTPYERQRLLYWAGFAAAMIGAVWIVAGRSKSPGEEGFFSKMGKEADKVIKGK